MSKPWKIANRPYWLYVYHHIDHTVGLPPSELHSWDAGLDDRAASESEREPLVREAFLKAGWEGDGNVEIFDIPPFLFSNEEDGVRIWHVKQSNNGTSWLASERELAKVGNLQPIPDMQKWP